MGIKSDISKSFSISPVRIFLATIFVTTKPFSFFLENLNNCESMIIPNKNVLQQQSQFLGCNNISKLWYIHEHNNNFRVLFRNRDKTIMFSVYLSVHVSRVSIMLAELQRQSLLEGAHIQKALRPFVCCYRYWMTECHYRGIISHKYRMSRRWKVIACHRKFVKVWKWGFSQPNFVKREGNSGRTGKQKDCF